MRGIGETFSAHAASGTGALVVPIAVTPARGLQPDLSLSYDAGAGNGPFGVGWRLSVPSITRKTDKRLPDYLDDIFVISGAEDLVPAGGRYRPRVENAFGRIEQLADSWRTISSANITSFFGRSDASRIADPRDPSRVFSWLLDRTEDALGNVITFEYVAEDLANVPATAGELHRLDGKAPVANRYLKRILYGPTVPGDETSCLFEVVFDYGDHAGDTPDATPGLWPARMDPFSSYRAGFDIRTYRLCRRVMVFHRIPELSAQPYLVRSTAFTYDDDRALAHLVAIEQRAHRAGETAAMPALRLRYTEAKPSNAAIAVEPDRIAIDGVRAQWVDLDGEGIPGVLSDGDGALYFRRNLGGGTLGSARAIVTRPSTAAPASGGQQLMDVGGDGRLDLVELEQPLPGFYERVPTGDGEHDWDSFRPFGSLPRLAWSDPSVRFIDLDGDGREDILIIGDDTFVWYPSVGKEGYGPPRTLPRPSDEELGPAVVFTDRMGSLVMADLSGDGLRDLVRVENGRICYWPNLGHGAFGAKVTMASSPLFDAHDQFDARRVLFADIDGTGASDVLYARRDGVRYWRNLAGNGWSEAHDVPALPPDAKGASITAVDVLGSGTACLVWSSTNPAESTMYYVDLTGTKPHLLQEVDNQLGLVTRIRYAPSTKFYLADRAAGIHWKTQLPFPVHVVERVETYDSIRRVRFVSEYAYRDGYFDGYEREFRGFGYVEQRDTESFGATLGKGLFADRPPPSNGEYPQPPVISKTWFHTGVWLDGERIFVDSGLTTDESRDAYRALRGRVLRQEVSCDDGKSDAPYSVTEYGYQVRCLQHADGDTHGVFFAHPRETVSWHYERDLSDPRIQHELVLETDDYGHERRRVAIGYPRAAGASDVRLEQTKLHAVLTELDVANEDQSGWYRHGVSLETRTYELAGLPAGMLSFDAVKAVADAAVGVPHDGVVPSGPSKRLLGRARTRYYDSSALPSALPFGQIDERAIPYENYGLAFTPTLLASIFGGRATDAILAEGGYAQDADGWWTPSGRSVPDPAQFYLPTQYLDPFGNPPTVVTYAHALVAVGVVDSRGNATTAELDYRTLTPTKITDPNSAVSYVELDVLGRPIRMWQSGRGEGDTPPGEPTTTTDYGFYDGTRPSYVHRQAREVHRDPSTRWQHTFSYFDGTGREVATKNQTTPGKAMQLVGGHCTEVDANPRWIGSGRTVFDNKGNPLKSYEPYFSITSDYEDEDALVCAGVTPLLHYDPLGRLVLVERPDGSAMRLEVTPWRQTSFDANDTVGDAGNLWLARMQTGTPAEQRAATLALAHAGTPSVVLFDTLGRSFSTIEDNKTELLETRTELDSEGNVLAVTDALGRTCVTTDYSMLGQPCHTLGIDAGEHWVLLDVAGQPLRRWEAERVVSVVYDQLHRPIETHVAVGGAMPMVVERTIYGEDAPDPSLYLRTRVYQTFDGAGVATTEAYDFKGNVLATTRQLATTYDATLDWSKAVPLGTEVFHATTTYDALNRVVSAAAPDQSVTWPTYDENSLLRSVDVQIRGASSRTTFVAAIEYAANHQRTRIVFGAGVSVSARVTTDYTYDALTFRLVHARTVRPADGAVLQDLTYTYDPRGNIVEVADAAQQDVYHSNTVVPPGNQYTYDAVYRLISATGREHLGQLQVPETTWDDAARVRRPHPNDEPMRAYTESYAYDAASNFIALTHAATGGNWTRTYACEPGTNRLASTTVGGLTTSYTHDDVGNMTQMPHLPVMQWDVLDRLRATARQVALGGATPETTYYCYDARGMRSRKVTNRQAAAGSNATRRAERIYLGGYEIYREYGGDGASVTLERQTLHVMDDTRRIALVESRVTGDDGSPVQLIRYQLANHLGSSCVEVDGSGSIISYEEYYPYGSTSYQAVRSQVEAPKRYRFTAKERDEETGLADHGARYYAPWLGRWTAVDPAGRAGPRSPFAYVRCNPIAFIDPNGKWDWPWESGPKVAPQIAKRVIGRVTMEMQIREAIKAGEPPEKIRALIEKYKAMQRDEAYAGSGATAPTIGGVDIRDFARAMAPQTFQNLRPNDPLANQDLPEGVKQLYGRGAQDDIAVKGANAAKQTFEQGVTAVLPGEANLALAIVKTMVDPSGENAAAAALAALLTALHLSGAAKAASEAIKAGKAVIIEGALDASQAKVVRDAVRQTMLAAGKAVGADAVKGEAAELAAAWILHGQFGHEVLGSIQKAGGQGIDLITKFKGVYFVWEIKANSAAFTQIQRAGAEFVSTRLREAIEHPELFAPAAVELAKKVDAVLGTERVVYAGFRLTGL